MAKPGSADAGRIAAGMANAHGAVDLGARAMTDEQAAEIGSELELATGMRCFGCGRRVAMGFRFTSIDPREPERAVMELTACNRQDCDFALHARRGAIAVEMVEYAWLDEAGVDAPAVVRIVARNEQIAAEAAQAT